ncbi:hypothetical protein FQZ97_843230 [compost metagenome]
MSGRGGAALQFCTQGRHLLAGIGQGARVNLNASEFDLALPDRIAQLLVLRQGLAVLVLKLLRGRGGTCQLVAEIADTITSNGQIALAKLQGVQPFRVGLHAPNALGDLAIAGSGLRVGGVQAHQFLLHGAHALLGITQRYTGALDAGLQLLESRNAPDRLLQRLDSGGGSLAELVQLANTATVIHPKRERDISHECKDLLLGSRHRSAVHRPQSSDAGGDRAVCCGRGDVGRAGRGGTTFSAASAPIGC